MRETVFLNTDREMPLLGLGVYKTADNEAETAITAAVNAGYRLIDTASAYKNEESVGKAIAKCGVPRKELFITSKIWNNAQRLGDVDGAFYRSMEQIHHLEELKKISGIVPAVNQIECHPLCYPKELIEYCQSEGIQVQAYAPLARGAYLDNDVMCVLGTKYAHTPAQVGLRWAIQKGISVIPKSVNPDRIASNANIFDFNIEDEDMAIMDTLNEDLHTSHVPDDLKDVIF